MTTGMANIGELESSKLTTQKYFFWRQEKLEIFLLVLKNSSSSKFQVFLAKTLQSFLFQKNIITLRLKPATSPSREMATKVKLLQQSRSRTNLVDPDQTKTADKCSSSVAEAFFSNIANKVSKIASMDNGFIKYWIKFEIHGS